MRFLSPTPIQAMAIPPALEGRDILGTAQTGTGKTGAFGIPIVAALIENRARKALILVPTRELASQIYQVNRHMTYRLGIYGALVVGGESFGRQVDELDRGVDYIVATPGRLLDHLNEGTLSLRQFDVLVFDEVDRMLDMGFAPQINKILPKLPKRRQTLFFSATLPREIQTLADRMLVRPYRAKVESTNKVVSKIVVKTIRTTVSDKSALLLKQLESVSSRVLVFTRTKSRADRLVRTLQREKHKAVCLHGGRTQGQRKRALEQFRSGSAQIMVATDLAGRGIDIDDIEQVVNYDLPTTREDYIHRIGRTGRFGKPGNALNFLTIQDFDGEQIISGKRRPGKLVYSTGRRRVGRSTR